MFQEAKESISNQNLFGNDLKATLKRSSTSISTGCDERNTMSSFSSESLNSSRRDIYGTVIKKGGRFHRISFNDELENKLIEVIPIEKYKSYNRTVKIMKITEQNSKKKSSKTSEDFEFERECSSGNSCTVF